MSLGSQYLATPYTNRPGGGDNSRDHPTNPTNPPHTSTSMPLGHPFLAPYPGAQAGTLAYITPLYHQNTPPPSLNPLPTGGVPYLHNQQPANRDVIGGVTPDQVRSIIAEELRAAESRKDRDRERRARHSGHPRPSIRDEAAPEQLQVPPPPPPPIPARPPAPAPTPVPQPRPVLVDHHNLPREQAPFIPPTHTHPQDPYAPSTAPHTHMHTAQVQITPPTPPTPVIVQLGPLIRSSGLESPDHEVMKAIYRYVDVGTIVTASNDSKYDQLQYMAHITFTDIKAAENFVYKWNSRYKEPYVSYTRAQRL